MDAADFHVLVTRVAILAFSEDEAGPWLPDGAPSFLCMVSVFVGGFS